MGPCASLPRILVVPAAARRAVAGCLWSYGLGGHPGSGAVTAGAAPRRPRRVSRWRSAIGAEEVRVAQQGGRAVVARAGDGQPARVAHTVGAVVGGGQAGGGQGGEVGVGQQAGRPADDGLVDLGAPGVGGVRQPGVSAPVTKSSRPEPPGPSRSSSSASSAVG